MPQPLAPKGLDMRSGHPAGWQKLFTLKRGLKPGTARLWPDAS
jgi:hypothetical protein